jgi:hypothetical protein
MKSDLEDRASASGKETVLISPSVNLKLNHKFRSAASTFLKGYHKLADDLIQLFPHAGKS